MIEVDGQLVLDDPDAMAVIRAIGRVNCVGTYKVHKERIEHFLRRIDERGMSPAEVVVIIANVDDPLGTILAELLMPQEDWDPYRARGEIPYARGLANRTFIQAALDGAGLEAAKELEALEGKAVVVVDFGSAEVFGDAAFEKGTKQ